MAAMAGDARWASETSACALGKLPIWAFEGDPGVGHDSWTRTYDLSAGNDVYSWLLGFSRPSPSD
jgi:hypothetical protein